MIYSLLMMAKAIEVRIRGVLNFLILPLILIVYMLWPEMAYSLALLVYINFNSCIFYIFDLHDVISYSIKKGYLNADYELIDPANHH